MESQPHPPLFLQTEARRKKRWQRRGIGAVQWCWQVGGAGENVGARGSPLANERRPGESQIYSRSRTRSICRSQSHSARLLLA
jgi:hypothetical protein